MQDEWDDNRLPRMLGCLFGSRRGCFRKLHSMAPKESIKQPQGCFRMANLHWQVPGSASNLTRSPLPDHAHLPLFFVTADQVEMSNQDKPQKNIVFGDMEPTTSKCSCPDQHDQVVGLEMGLGDADQPPQSSFWLQFRGPIAPGRS